MPTVSATRSVEAPDGPVCENWNSDTYPVIDGWKIAPKGCDQLHRESLYGIPDGLGHSPGAITNYRCALFNVGLGYEYGVGVTKCAHCAAQI